MASSPEANLVADVVKQAPGLGGIDHLAEEASALLGVQDFRQKPELADDILRSLGDTDDLLKTLVWAERTKLDVDGNGIIEVGEGNDLIASDDIFVQLAAQFMSKGLRDVSFSELTDAARATAERNGTAFNETPVINGSDAGADMSGALPDAGDVMQFSGDPAPVAGDTEGLQGPQDALTRYKEEAQFLGVNFGSLDTNGDNLVDDGEFKAAVASDNITQLMAANIAMSHNLVTVQGDQFSSLSMDQVAADYFSAGTAATEGSDQLSASGNPAYVPEGSEAEGSYYQFSGEPGGEHPAYAPEEHPAYAPDEDSQSPEQSENLNTLNSKTASVKERLKAIAKLVESGKTTTTITDSDGTKFDVRMEVVPVAGSSRTMVHMFATDPQTGKEFVVLRAIQDGDQFTHQRDESGNEVDFTGTRWRQNYPQSMFLT